MHFHTLARRRRARAAIISIVSVVDTVGVETVMVAQASCADRQQAEVALASAMASVRAPRRRLDVSLPPPPDEEATRERWHLRVRVDAVAPGIKSADATIEDDLGRVVAERSVTDKTVSSCIGLTRAVGAWAQIVLDDELVRAHDMADRSADPSSLETQRQGPPPLVMTASGATDEGIDLGAGEPSRDDKPPFEVGTTLVLRNGVAATGGIFGASPFVTVGISRTIVLRPSLIIGTSTSRVPPDQSRSANMTMLGARLDLCRRFPGNYLDRKGIELDGCAGSDVAYVVSDLDRAIRASVGPSAVLRGELNSNFGIEIRGMVGANLARAGLGPDAPFIVAGAELGGSVRFR